MSGIKIQRVYDHDLASDDYKILVDRLWPRGISKEKLKADEWLKDLGPSTELRKWFNHEPEKYPEFKRKYIEELEDKIEILKEIKDRSEKQEVVLLYGAKDTEHNQAVVLKEVLNDL